MKSKGEIFNSRYTIKRFLGKGTFGTVFKIYDPVSGKHLALKLMSNNSSTFENEQKTLTKLRFSEGFPLLYDHGFSESYYFIILELLDRNLNQLFKKHQNKFSTSCTINIALQTLARIEHLHSLGLVHQDLKPDNFMSGLEKNKSRGTIFLVDFGLSSLFKNLDTGVHMNYAETGKVVGNLRFSSINNHRGILQTRRDDLESWFYMVCFFFSGKLPWDSEVLKKSNQEVYQAKIKTSAEYLCSLCPKGFTEVLSYIRSLQFAQKPDYHYIREKIAGYAGVDVNSCKLDWVSQYLNRKIFQKISKRRKRNKKKLKQVMTTSNFPTIKSWNGDDSLEYAVLNSSIKYFKRDHFKDENIRLDSNDQIDETLKNVYPAFTKSSRSYMSFS